MQPAPPPTLRSSGDPSDRRFLTRTSNDIGITLLVALTIFLFGLIFFERISDNIPVLREMRGFLFYSGWIQNISWSDAIFHPVGSISSATRIVPMLFMAMQRQTCGFAPHCLNNSQDVLLATAAALLFLHGKQLFGKRRIALLVSFLWCVSVPALGGALWQDTQFDKFAMIFSLLYLITLFYFVRLPQPGAISYLLCNLVLTVLLFLAFKSKEFCFFLLPATLVVIILFRLKPGWKGVYALGRYVVLPVLYGTYYVGYYMQHIPEDLRHHVSSGKISTVLSYLGKTLLGYGEALGTGNWGSEYEHLAYPAAVTMAVTIVLVALSCVVGMLLQVRFPAPSAARAETPKNIAYLLCLLLFQTVILARTLHPSAYYLLLPEGLFLSLVVACACVPVPGLSTAVDASRKVLLLALLSSSVLLSYFSQQTSGSAAYRMQYMGKIINDSFATIREAVPPEQVKDAEFYFADHIDGEWYLFYPLVTDDNDPELMSFVYRKPVSADVTYTFKPRDPAAVVPAGRLQVVWRPNGSVAGIYLGGKAVLIPTW